MFTLKFYDHDYAGNADDPHEVFGAERYNVTAERRGEEKCEDGAPFNIVRMYRTPDDDNPYYETVGSQERFGRVFIMNNAGQTVDTIR